MSDVPCINCRLHRECTPEGLEFEPTVVGESPYATLICPCDCHPDKPLAERLVDERRRINRALMPPTAAETHMEDDPHW